MRLVPVPCDQVASVWAAVEPLIARAIEKGPCGADLEAVRDRCISRDHQLWIAASEKQVAGAAVTGIANVKGRDVCEWIAVGGLDWSSWQHLQTPIEQWARENGCVAMRGFFRTGWHRLMPEYRIVGHIMEKEI